MSRRRKKLQIRVCAARDERESAGRGLKRRVDGVSSPWMRRREIIQSVSYSGHESFPLRFSWLAKAVRTLEATPHHDVFNHDNAVVLLGVGKNMVRSIRHWATRSEVIAYAPNEGRGGLEVTALGRLLFGSRGADPYLEDPGTAWLIHWQLATNRQCTTWYWMFNEFRPPSFTIDEAVAELLRVAEEVGGKRPSRGTVQRDVSCLVRTYVPTEPDRRLSREDTYDSPLTELALLYREVESGRFAFDRAARSSIPAEVFAYASLRFWEHSAAGSRTLSFESLAYAPGGPGQVFKLTESACFEFLERMDACTAGALSLTTTAGLRQLVRRRNIDPLSILKRYYGRQLGKIGVA